MSPLDKEHAEIRQLIMDWSAAVRRKDYDGVLKSHSRNVLMFDVPPPFESEGIYAYRKT
jgi:ketosteroid isomerase-like protein